MTRFHHHWAVAIAVFFACLFFQGASFADSPLAPPTTALKAFGLGANSDQPLPAAEAFAMSDHWQQDTLTLKWHIAEGHYLYRDKLNISLDNAPLAKLHINYPPAKTIQDPFFGQERVYQHTLSLPITVSGQWPSSAQLVVQYQGCSGRLCYPPTIKHFALPKSTQPQQGLSAALHHSKYLWALLLLLGLGILLCFTPCVLPMIPIITGIVLGKKNLSKMQAFALSLSYVLGMALCYAILGLVIARIGASFQGFLQQPAVIIVSAIIFVLLALSLFGVYRIELPHRAQTFLAKLNHRQQGGHLLGAFLMGLLAALVVSPCTSAPLIGVLGYIAQSGNMIFGAVALFVLAIGMGIPLILIAIAGHHALPKAGIWMYQIQRLLAFLMLGVALWLLSRILPDAISMLLLGVLLIAYAISIGLLKRTQGGKEKIKRLLASIIALYGLLLVIGGLEGNSSLLSPLSITTTKQNTLPFTQIHNLQQLQQALAKAKQAHQPVLLDFYANWCVECRKLDAFTLSDARVKAALKDYQLLRVDISGNTAKDRELMKSMNIIGLPTLIFYDINGHTKHNERLYGDIDPSQFLAALSRT